MFNLYICLLYVKERKVSSSGPVVESCPQNMPGRLPSILHRKINRKKLGKPKELIRIFFLKIPLVELLIYPCFVFFNAFGNVGRVV